jgi:hypothetical protein
MSKLPQYGWLSLQLEEAEALARAATWKPVSPKTFLTLARDRRKRLVDNDQELLGLMVGSLDRRQAKFKDELTGLERSLEYRSRHILAEGLGGSL